MANRTNNGGKRGRRNYQSDRRQIEASYLLANIQVIVWLVLSLVASVLNYTLDLWLIATLIGTGLANIEPVSVVIPASTNVVNVLFLLQLRAANKRMDDIRNKLFEVR